MRFYDIFWQIQNYFFFKRKGFFLNSDTEIIDCYLYGWSDIKNFLWKRFINKENKKEVTFSPLNFLQINFSSF